MVYVLNKEGKPLMACKPVIGRLLVTQGKARVKSITPFVIVLNYETTNYVQKLTFGVDTGSDVIGCAVVNDQTKDVVYLNETKIRNDISKKLKQRSKYRRNRRNRKTRYRKARFLNRRNSTKTGRFSPTMVSKINSHLREINSVYSILPVTKLILETATFDTTALTNPAVLTNKWLYQKGLNYGFANTKAYVLDRDSYTCQSCSAKKVRLEVHHIIFKSNGGSDEAANLITLCKDCHDKIHHNQLVLRKKGIVKKQTKHATQMNSIRKQLLKLLPNAEETFGFITKEHRQLMGLPKGHCFDAVAIASGGCDVNFNDTKLLLKKHITSGDYQQTKGVRSEQKLPTGKIQGFRKFDKVKFKGTTYFIKGKMSTGYAFLMNISGETIALKPMAKFSQLKRITARKSCLITTVEIHPRN
jgi:hypothetical protein